MTLAVTNGTKQTISNMAKKNPQVVLGLGDYSYERSEKCWIDIMQPLLKKMKITIGNHDILPFGKISRLVEEFNLTLPW